MPLGCHADCRLRHIHPMRCACCASALQHGLNMPHIHALATASIQKHHLSCQKARDVAHAGRLFTHPCDALRLLRRMCHADCQHAAAARNSCSLDSSTHPAASIKQHHHPHGNQSSCNSPIGHM